MTLYNRVGRDEKRKTTDTPSEKRRARRFAYPCGKVHFRAGECGGDFLKSVSETDARGFAEGLECAPFSKSFFSE